jgi:soluble lytic murein transglycosylase
VKRVVALSIALALGPGCACKSTPPPPPAAAPVTSVPPVASASPPPDEHGTFDPAVARALLADPKLSAVQAAIDAGEPGAAAQALERPLADAAADRPLLSFLMGRQLMQAKRPRDAVSAFEAAIEPAWPLSSYAACAAAEAALRAGDADRAIALSQRLTAEGPGAATCRLARADALEVKGDLAAALPLWREHVASAARPARWAEVALKAARALVTRDPGEALTLARRVAIELPASSLAGAAHEVERTALDALPPAERAARAARSHEDEATRLAALLDAGKTDDALSGASSLDGSLTDGERRGELGCKVASTIAKANTKKRRRADAAEAWSLAEGRCTGDAHANALYQGGVVASQAGRAADAMSRFEKLEREHPKHRLADDARVKGAIAAKNLGDEARFVARLERIGDDYPEGDLSADGLFRLALHWIEKGNWAAAVAPLEVADRLRPREHEYWAAGRTPYFHARALLATGDRVRAIAELSRVVTENPLSYYMALAHARLHELDAKAAAAALERVSVPNDTPLAVPDNPAFHTPGFARAIELLRLGETDAARAELSALGLPSPTTPPEVLWALAELYGASGATTLAHTIPRGRVVDWLDHWPTGSWRRAWELAYPRPWLPVVAREAKKNQIPTSLAYAIMREESAFDAAVVSSAQAYGLMQIVMPTARTLAKKVGTPVSEALLKTPPVNVALGCRYLADLRAAFPACPALAIPSYNAGPGAPRKWIAARPYDDLDVFVERIPYEETRNYTKRVLKSYVAYLWLYEPEHLAEALRLPKKTNDAAPPPAPSQPDDEPRGEP